ncbi:hypothetical protein J4G43_031985 [Bradyrhizobium barranii subsp. barranii]|uniref:Uncharacterized protein n=1 Tax=Bradyrhizobium barranii subsp. barranii TaxID=2823807 RepID=A0A9X9YCH8_9BRAD|nr:hypothetical protein [Bradyrhizobium barranii]UEM17622.1 hypothetical protein J4G43_031985 [Bradyrhizobium barranii subsp. barranii]
MADFIVFRCPQTGMNVQTHLERQPRPDERSLDERRLEGRRLEGRSFESFACPACTRLHFIDLASGQPMNRNR